MNYPTSIDKNGNRIMLERSSSLPNSITKEEKEDIKNKLDKAKIWIEQFGTISAISWYTCDKIPIGLEILMSNSYWYHCIFDMRIHNGINFVDHVDLLIYNLEHKEKTWYKTIPWYEFEILCDMAQYIKENIK